MKKYVVMLMAVCAFIFCAVTVRAEEISVPAPVSAQVQTQQDCAGVSGNIIDVVKGEGKCSCCKGKCSCGCEKGKSCSCAKCCPKCQCGCEKGKSCSCTKCCPKCCPKCECGCREGKPCSCGCEKE